MGECKICYLCNLIELQGGLKIIVLSFRSKIIHMWSMIYLCIFMKEYAHVYAHHILTVLECECLWCSLVVSLCFNSLLCTLKTGACTTSGTFGSGGICGGGILVVL